MSLIHGEKLSSHSNPFEIRLRIAGKSPDKTVAGLVGEEVECLIPIGLPDAKEHGNMFTKCWG